MRTPSYEYVLLHQFEVVFRDGEHKTRDASRDYSKVWESIIDNPPAEGVTPVHVYRLNGTTCAVIAGMDELIENEECAMEIARLAADRAKLLDRIKELEGMVPKWVGTKEMQQLERDGWYNVTDDKIGNGPRQWLMLPPIPLPKGGE